MNFNQLKTEVKTIQLQENRADKEDYLEVVLGKIKLPDLTAILEKHFGPAAWPSKEKISQPTELVIGKFGGIMPGQTLYAKIEDEICTFAMIWPWQSAEYATLKIGLQKFKR